MKICRLISSMAQLPVGRGLLIIESSLSHWLRHTTIGRIPLDKWSGQLRDLNLTTHDTHKKQTCMSPARFKSAIPVSKRPQIHGLDRAGTGVDRYSNKCINCITYTKKNKKIRAFRMEVNYHHTKDLISKWVVFICNF